MDCEVKRDRARCRAMIAACFILSSWRLTFNFNMRSPVPPRDNDNDHHEEGINILASTTLTTASFLLLLVVAPPILRAAVLIPALP